MKTDNNPNKSSWINRKREAGHTPPCIGEERDCAEEWIWATAGSVLTGISKKSLCNLSLVLVAF